MVDIDQIRINSYAKKTLKAGFSEDSIRSILRLRGFPDDKIDSALSSARPAPGPKPAAVAGSPRLKPNIIIPVGILIVLCLLILFMILAKFNALPGIAQTKCSTVECFVSTANQCGEASYINDVEGTSIYASTRGCVLTMSLEQLNETEPEEVRALFENTSMECPYEKGSFNSSMAGNDFGSWIDNCSGTLADAIYQLRAVAALASG